LLASWRKTDDCPGTRSQPAHGLRRGRAKNSNEVHHGRATALALIENPSAPSLRACGAKPDTLRKDLTNFINEHTPTVAGEDDIDTQPTLGFQRVIQRAILHVQSSGKKEVNGANVLVAIYGEKDSHAVYFLQKQGVTRLDVVNYISHGISKVPHKGDARRRDRDRRRESEPPAELSSNLKRWRCRARSTADRRTRNSARRPTLCRRARTIRAGRRGRSGKDGDAKAGRRVVEGEEPKSWPRPTSTRWTGRPAGRKKFRATSSSAERRAEGVLDNTNGIAVHRRNPTPIGRLASRRHASTIQLLKPALSSAR
jgi:ATP-dependent Clp protease ATP-binding subunit ClpA